MEKKNLIWNFIGLGIMGGIGYLFGKRNQVTNITVNSTPSETKPSSSTKIKPTRNDIRLALLSGKKFRTRDGDPVKVDMPICDNIWVKTEKLNNGSPFHATVEEFWEFF